jgi:cysteinyl-tRNA synthetase
LTRELNKVKENDQDKAEVLASALKFLGGLLGILQDDPDQWLKGNTSFVEEAVLQAAGTSTATFVSNLYIDTAGIEQQIQTRLDAKKAKNWALADQIRNELKEQGVILEDAPNGTTSWRRA